MVAIDDELIEAIDDAFERRAADDPEGGGESDRSLTGLAHRRSPRAESKLSPRDIQARLRSGRSISEVARAAGVDEDWVARFAAPIQAEQAQVIARVRSIVYSKQRLGSSAQPLGVAVLWNLRDKGVVMYDDTFEEGWTAFHVRESEWIVRFAYINRKKAQHAEWLVDLADGELISRNRLASELAYVEPGRRRRPPAPMGDAPAPPQPATRARPPTRKAPAKKARARKATKPKKTTTKKATAKKATAKKATAKRAATKKSATKKAATKKATTKKATGKRAAAKKATTKRATTKRATTKRATTKRAGSRTRAPAPVEAPALLSPSAARRERRAQRIPPSTTPRQRVAVNPVVATAPSRSFVPSPSGRPAPRVEPTISERSRPAAPSPSRPPVRPPAGEPEVPTPPPVAEPQAEPERQTPLIIIDDADSSVRRISSRTSQGSDPVTIRAPMAASTLPPPAPAASRRFGRRRARSESIDERPVRDR
ncbi:MAG: hypothetical protein QOG03_2388 [Actinomycetota bacterium]|nr:hypothetical protein [Actinomycetota bacterium]